MGRHRKSTVLKILDGEKDQKLINRLEPQPPVIGKEPPACLDAVAKAKWRELVEMDESLGVLTMADADHLMIYCHLWSCWMDVRAKKDSTGGAVLVTKDATGRIITRSSPWAVQEFKLLDQIRKYGGMLGLNPSGRSGIVARKPSVGGSKKQHDQFAELFRRQYG